MMNIKSIEFTELKSLGDFQHRKITANAELSDTDDPEKCMTKRGMND